MAYCCIVLSLFLLLAAAATAFTLKLKHPVHTASRSLCSSSDQDVPSAQRTINDMAESDSSSSSGIKDIEAKPKRYMSWPFNSIESPALLTGELAADCGFDPLRIVQSNDQLFTLREAEVKHARLAMLGSLGWPTSELYHAQIAKSIGMPSLLQDGKVPSVLNGGMDNLYILGTLGLFLAVGIVLELELIKLKKELNGPDDLRNFYNMFNEEGFDVPGNYRFDPLSLGKLLCGDNSKRRLLIQTMEIFNGRMSMLACVGYAMQEYFTDSPVIRETPVFFFPLTDSLV